jgi:ribonuclease HI
MTDEAEVILYTDGACSGNPGPGGWAAILHHVRTGRRKEISGGQAETTNNRMELTAMIKGLEALKRPCKVRLVTDSEYLSKGVSLWMPRWRAQGWRQKKNKAAPPMNVDLWKRIAELIDRHDVTTEWVAGHAGHPENERCDELAVAQAQRFLR